MLESLERRYRFICKIFPFLDFLSYSGNIHIFWVSTFYIIELLSFSAFMVMLFLNMNLMAAALAGSAAMAHSYNIYFIQEFWKQTLSVDENNGKSIFLYRYMWLIDMSVKGIGYFSVFTGNIPFIIFSILCYSVVFAYSYYKWNNP